MQAQHTILPLAEIKRRADAIGLTMEELGRRAGTSPSTANRGLRGITDARESTLKKLTAALNAREKELVTHLAGVLHGDAA